MGAYISGCCGFCVWLAKKRGREPAAHLVNDVIKSDITDIMAYIVYNEDLARRSSAEHLIATKALRCTATTWMLTAAESFAKF